VDIVDAFGAKGRWFWSTPPLATT